MYMLYIVEVDKKTPLIGIISIALNYNFN